MRNLKLHLKIVHLFTKGLSIPSRWEIPEGQVFTVSIFSSLIGQAPKLRQIREVQSSNTLWMVCGMLGPHVKTCLAVILGGMTGWNEQRAKCTSHGISLCKPPSNSLPRMAINTRPPVRGESCGVTVGKVPTPILPEVAPRLMYCGGHKGNREVAPNTECAVASKRRWPRSLQFFRVGIPWVDLQGALRSNTLACEIVGHVAHSDVLTVRVGSLPCSWWPCSLLPRRDRA